jgi:hypothetical protein
MNIILADLATGNDFVLLDTVQGIPGPASPSNAYSCATLNFANSPHGTPAVTAAFTMYDVDCTAGSVDLQVPLLTTGQWVSFKLLLGTLATNPAYLIPHAGVMTEGIFPVGTPGTYATTTQVLNVTGMLGSTLWLMMGSYGYVRMMT